VVHTALAFCWIRVICFLLTLYSCSCKVEVTQGSNQSALFIQNGDLFHVLLKIGMVNFFVIEESTFEEANGDGGTIEFDNHLFDL